MSLSLAFGLIALFLMVAIEALLVVSLLGCGALP